MHWQCKRLIYGHPIILFYVNMGKDVLEITLCIIVRYDSKYVYNFFTLSML
jgi:hypothetical protein